MINCRLLEPVFENGVQRQGQSSLLSLLQKGLSQIQSLRPCPIVIMLNQVNYLSHYLTIFFASGIFEHSRRVNRFAEMEMQYVCRYVYQYLASTWYSINNMVTGTIIITASSNI